MPDSPTRAFADLVRELTAEADLAREQARDPLLSPSMRAEVEHLTRADVLDDVVYRLHHVDTWW